MLAVGFLPELDLTRTELAARMGVDPEVISELIRGNARVTPELADKLGKALGVSAQFWINAQERVDTWDSEQNILT